MLTNPPVEGNTCNLDCLRRNPVRTFDGPVKIVLVDIPKKEYCKRIWWAGLIGLSYIFVGFSAITMMMFACSWKLPNIYNNIHVFFCTAGFQLLIPIGILMTTNLNGPSAPLKPIDRRKNHVALQLVAIIMNIVGAALVLALGPLAHKWPTIVVETGHAFFGVMAIVLSGLTLFLGPLVFCKSSCSQGFRSLHAVLGLCGYLCSSISFGYSLFKPSFLSWLSLDNVDIGMMVVFVSISTAVIVIYPSYKLLCTGHPPAQNVGFQ